MPNQHLEKLNRVIDPEHVARSEQRITAAVSFAEVDRLPVSVGFPASDWPSYSYRECFHDVRKMLLSELAAVWAGAHVRDNRMYTIRANYGVGAIASMFGCEIVLTDDNAMPWVAHLDEEELDRALDAGPVDIEAGLGARVLETERFYLDQLSRHDNLARCVHVYCSDTQGPFDIAHLVMGHRIYTEMYDNPDRVHRLLELTTDAYTRFTLAQKQIIGEDPASGFHFHAQTKARGSCRICDDSGINISTESYTEFCKPYNERAFAALAGGWIHYCGGGRQILSEVISTEGVTGINFGNPEQQDVRDVYSQAAPRQVALLGWPLNLPLPAGANTGVTLAAFASDLESARRIACG